MWKIALPNLYSYGRTTWEIPCTTEYFRRYRHWWLENSGSRRTSINLRLFRFLWLAHLFFTYPFTWKTSPAMWVQEYSTVIWVNRQQNNQNSCAYCIWSTFLVSEYSLCPFPNQWGILRCEPNNKTTNKYIISFNQWASISILRCVAITHLSISSSLILLMSSLTSSAVISPAFLACFWAPSFLPFLCG